jgi:hypothetical protein
MRTGFWVAALAAVLTIGAAKEARADTGFYTTTTTGVGAGVYQYFSGGGIGNIQTWSGFSFHITGCAGAHFGDHFGLGLGAIFQPLISLDHGTTVGAPGGFAGACIAFRGGPVQFELITGFGGMGASKIFGGIGPGWSPALTFDVVRTEHIALTLGARVTLMYGWEPDNRRADPGFYVAPNATVGFAFW